ncbi:uncharacterized protein LOC134699027 [Mytilus trossulus]|uniref:uncharacterized protein LOC134699027 n=1 Tax=Mytilus trossulus TaxID=6551 RepID=UPI003007EB8B
MIFIELLVSSLFVSASFMNPTDVGPTYMDDATIDTGKTSFQKFQSKSEFPVYGYCWKELIVSLEKGCKFLTAEIHGKLALSFLNCFLQMSGRPIYECDDQQKFLECTQSMKDTDHILLLNFFIDTKSMCYFLEVQVWNYETQQTINRLTHILGDVNTQLDHGIINPIMHYLRETLNKFEKLSDSNAYLHDMLSKVINKSEEQDQLLSQFNHIVSQISSWSTVFFSLLSFTCVLIISFLLTSTPLTKSARPWLLFIAVITFWIEEYAIVWWRSLRNQQTGSDLEHHTYKEVWRGIACLLAIIAFGYSAICGKDKPKEDKSD